MAALNRNELKGIGEEQLVSECRRNNPLAQRVLFDTYAEPMTILCLRYIVQPEEAREVMMDGFLSFFRNLHSFQYQGAGSVKAWLKKITVNQCLMHLRRRRLQFAPVDGHHAAMATPENVLDGLSAREIMNKVQSLPDGYRTVFNLHVFEGMSHREIGALLGISENTSKSQLFKARELLQKKIQQAN